MNSKNVVSGANGSRTITRRVQESQTLPDGGTIKTWRSENIGREVYTWRADVNLTDLEAMAARAAHNKTGKCRDGALVVTIVSRRPLT
jgi:hypothetical protein